MYVTLIIGKVNIANYVLQRNIAEGMKKWRVMIMPNHETCPYCITKKHEHETCDDMVRRYNAGLLLPPEYVEETK